MNRPMLGEPEPLEIEGRVVSTDVKVHCAHCGSSRVPFVNRKASTSLDEDENGVVMRMSCLDCRETTRVRVYWHKSETFVQVRQDALHE